MKTKILTLLFLIAIVGIQLQFIAYAAEPPSISSPLADDDDDTLPPSLGADDTDTTPPALGGGDDDTSDSTSVPGTGGVSLPAGDDDDDTVTVEYSDYGTTGETGESSQSTGILSSTGPEMAFLLIPSLILGYACKKKK